jgi:hypothetical protein
MAWEVDWTRRKAVGRNVYVWARNPTSRRPAARDWHWAGSWTLRSAGVPWFPSRPGAVARRDAEAVERRREVWAALSAGYPQPSIRELAKRFGVRHEVVLADLAALEAAGYVRRGDRARAVDVLIPLVGTVR